jgi:hypothetical protein
LRRAEGYRSRCRRLRRFRYAWLMAGSKYAIWIGLQENARMTRKHVKTHSCAPQICGIRTVRVSEDEHCRPCPEQGLESYSQRSHGHRCPSSINGTCTCLATLYACLTKTLPIVCACESTLLRSASQISQEMTVSSGFGRLNRHSRRHADEWNLSLAIEKGLRKCGNSKRRTYTILLGDRLVKEQGRDRSTPAPENDQELRRCGRSMCGQ